MNCNLKDTKHLFILSSILLISGVSKTLIATLFTAAGGAEIFARIFNGWLADRGVMSAMNHLALCIIITGICAFICAAVSSIPGIELQYLVLCVLDGWSKLN